ncbi:MAG: helix-turn-helix transcriptional regulator [Ktedonobacteraceae bacterium]|nr:helix-turn-helix transcriptional regulator [Ktedonobacteraceae bacterium]
METNAAQVQPLHQGRLVASYRQAAHLSQQDLADLMGVSIHTVQRMEKQVVIKDVERRQLLIALLGIPAAYLQLTTDTQEQQVERVMLVYNDDPMSFLEDTVNARWTTLLIGGALHTASGLGRLVQGVESFAQRIPESGWYRRAHMQLSMVYQLRGSVEGDLLHHQQALDWYQKAHTVAWELQDAELMAAARVREGIILLRNKQPREAIDYLTNAVDLVQGKGLPLLRGNTLCILSEAYARVGQAQECWRTLGLAERALEQTPQAQERSYREFHAEFVHAQKGIVALILQDHDRAVRLFDKSLKTYPPTRVPAKAGLIVRQAEAYYGQGSVDYSADAAKEAFSLAVAVGKNNILVRVKQLHTKLLHDGWTRERGTVELGMMIGEYERARRQVIPSRDAQA